MIMTRRTLVLVMAVSIVAMRPCLAQSTAASTPPAPPVLTPEEMGQFLRQANIVATKSSKKGVTNAKRVTLFDGRIRHDAQIQDVNIELPIFEVGPKYTEVNFKDLFRYNIAGYRLSLLLGLDNVPMSVERKVQG
jgi:hypothetical protein